MSSCSAKEVSKGYAVTNPGLLVTAVAIDTAKNFSVITAFNETDQDIKVAYKNQDGDAADFIVPKNGRSFTRNINGDLLANSLTVQALDSAATGKVIFNLGN